MSKLNYNPIIVALDVDRAEEALRLAEILSEVVGGFKIGARLFTAEGPQFIRRMKTFGKLIFLDLKYHDIPNTVAGAVSAAVQLGVDMLTVHASGGREMLVAAEESARTTAERLGIAPPLVLAVTVLTSLNETHLRELGVDTPLPRQVVRLAQMAVESGLRGIVCSPEELELLRSCFPGHVKLVTPGIRLAPSADDQKRTLDARSAIMRGADWIVVGRPIYKAADPVLAARQLLASLEDLI